MTNNILDYSQINAGGIAEPPVQDTFVIPNGSSVTIFRNHRYLRILALSGGATGVSIRFGQSGTATNIIGAGIQYGLDGIVPQSTIFNNSGASITITIITGLAPIQDDRLTVSGIVNVQISAATLSTNADVACAATATTQVLAANSARKEAIISNLIANGVFVRVGNASTGAARGVELAPGSSIVLETTAAISVYNPAATSINIGVAEVIY